jgi:ABC-2 type transport system permease protein/oleandomycin transport system permease protein
MTVLTAAVDDPGVLVQARWTVSDTLTIAKRILVLWLRIPTFIAFTVIQPVMFVLLFRYVFGGAIPVHVTGGYVSFLMPGIIGQSAAFATFLTAVALV